MSTTQLIEKCRGGGCGCTTIFNFSVISSFICSSLRILQPFTVCCCAPPILSPEGPEVHQLDTSRLWAFRHTLSFPGQTTKPADQRKGSKTFNKGLIKKTKGAFSADTETVEVPRQTDHFGFARFTSLSVVVFTEFRLWVEQKKNKSRMLFWKSVLCDDRWISSNTCSQVFTPPQNRTEALNRTYQLRNSNNRSEQKTCLFYPQTPTRPQPPANLLPSPSLAAGHATRLCHPVAARQCWALSGLSSSSVVLAATSARPRLLGSAAAVHSFPKNAPVFLF